MSPLRVSVARRPEELAALAARWEALAASALEPNPAYEPWMMLPALRAFGSEGLRVVLVRNERRLLGLFPLQPQRGGEARLVRTLASWRYPHCMLGVPLVDAQRAGEVLAALLGWARREASVVALDQVPADGAFHHALVDAVNEGGRVLAVGAAYTRPLLCRQADAEAYLAASLAGDLRRDLRRKEKRLAEAGRLTRVALSSREDLGRWIDDFLALEASGWKGRRGSALACSEASRRFAVETFTGAFERGKLVMLGLDLDGRPIARYSAFTSGEGAISFKTAYDEGVRRYGPGILAEIDMIREFHRRRGLLWMDSCTGPGNPVLASLWKDRRTVQRMAVATDLAGEAALAALPLAQWAARAAGRLRRIGLTPVRIFPSVRPA
jgi:CelD/BcsL family acetyltransferase involved in cellulose biosynthesis